MTTRDLALLVRACRTAQRRYFRDRTPTALDVAKRLERETDEAVALVLADQRDLFDSSPGEEGP